MTNSVQHAFMDDTTECLAPWVTIQIMLQYKIKQWLDLMISSAIFRPRHLLCYVISLFIYRTHVLSIILLKYWSL